MLVANNSISLIFITIRDVYRLSFCILLHCIIICSLSQRSCVDDTGTPIPVPKDIYETVPEKDFDKVDEITFTSPPGRGRYMFSLTDDEMIEVKRTEGAPFTVNQNENGFKALVY